MKSRSAGKIILFGSGETSQSGKSIFRKILSTYDRKQKIAILETPAGFQPNSELVAQEIADIFRVSLTEFTQSVSIIPARKKGTDLSPENPALLFPLKTSDFILMGPGSPTYTVNQLKNTVLWKKVLERWQKGSTLCFSSAAALACGKFTLPVYEIYKAGSDLCWIEGLNIFQKLELPLSIITHFNNTEGGRNLDTRFCYMGSERFNNLQKLLPDGEIILGIDENTAVIFDFADSCFHLEGQATATVINNGIKSTFKTEIYYSMESMTTAKITEVKKANQNTDKKIKPSSDQNYPVSVNNLPAKLKTLLADRLNFKSAGNFKKADEIRDYLRSKGYEIRDADKGQEVYKTEEKSHP